MQQLQKLSKYVQPYWKQMTLAALSLTLWSLISLALPYSARFLVDSVFVSYSRAELNRIVLIMFGLFVFQAGLGYVQNYLLNFLGQRVIADLRLSLQQHLLYLPMRFFKESKVGEIVSRVTNDVTTLQAVLTQTPIALLRQIVTIIGGITLMALMNWQLTLFIFVIIPPIILLAVFFGRRMEKLSTTIQDRLAGAVSALEESISGIRIVKSFTQEPYEEKRFKDRIERTFDTTMERTRVRAAFVPLVSLLGLASVTGIMWVGGQFVINGSLTPGELVAFLFYMIMVAAPLGEFAGVYAQIREAIGAASRIFEIMATSSEPKQSEKAKQLPPVVGRVEFHNVCFGYEKDDLVLKDIHLTVRPSEVIALVGPSGVGKTTLVNLIPRFFDPTEGWIKMDGHLLTEVTLESLRSQVGLVPQENFLFGGTIAENIAYGNLRASQDQIQKAAEAAYAHDFILDLPKGYETEVGERGVKLSAGQRQRIAIARALLKDPRILILDEATSALDSESEQMVQKALKALMENRTTFVIAHRLSTIKNADRILVLQHGEIVEEGSHETLIKKEGGVYHRLWALQFPEEEE
jgi:ATP-binding cassette, subfamily B, bacterial MsbA